jgi:hypothetical protein
MILLSSKLVYFWQWPQCRVNLLLEYLHGSK